MWWKNMATRDHLRALKGAAPLKLVVLQLDRCFRCHLRALKGAAPLKRSGIGRELGQEGLISAP